MGAEQTLQTTSKQIMVCGPPKSGKSFLFNIILKSQNGKRPDTENKSIINGVFYLGQTEFNLWDIHGKCFEEMDKMIYHNIKIEGLIYIIDIQNMSKMHQSLLSLALYLSEQELMEIQYLVILNHIYHPDTDKDGLLTEEDFKQFREFHIEKFKSLEIYMENKSQITITMYSEFNKNVAEESTDDIKLWFNTLETRMKSIDGIKAK